VDIASCWVLGGVHGEGLVRRPGDFDLLKAEAAAAHAGVAPIATVPFFVW
jgi:hypothetical protein